MTGRRSRRKGAGYELELCRDAAEFGFHGRRTPNSGGLAIKGDVTAIDGTGPMLPGFHLEAKRQETLAIPAWLRQAYADAGALVPLVVFRRNRTRALDPLGTSHAVIPWRDLLGLLAELRDLRAEVERAACVSECVPLCGAARAYGRSDAPWKHEPECPVRLEWEQHGRPPTVRQLDVDDFPGVLCDGERAAA